MKFAVICDYDYETFTGLQTANLFKSITISRTNTKYINHGTLSIRCILRSFRQSNERFAFANKLMPLPLVNDMLLLSISVRDAWLQLGVICTASSLLDAVRTKKI